MSRARRKVAEPLSGHEILKYDQVADALYATSPMENGNAKLLLCQQAATYYLQMRALTQKLQEGTINVDESRALPPTGNMLLKTLERLGVDSLPDPEAQARAEFEQMMALED